MDADLMWSLLRDAPLVAVLYFVVILPMQRRAARNERLLRAIATKLGVRVEPDSGTIEMPDGALVVPSSLASDRLRRRRRVRVEPDGYRPGKHDPAQAPYPAPVADEHTPIEPIG